MVSAWAEQLVPSEFNPGQILPPMLMTPVESADVLTMEKVILEYRVGTVASETGLKLLGTPVQVEKLHIALKEVWAEAGYENDMYLPRPTALAGHFQTKYMHTVLTARLGTGMGLTLTVS